MEWVWVQILRIFKRKLINIFLFAYFAYIFFIAKIFNITSKCRNLVVAHKSKCQINIWGDRKIKTVFLEIKSFKMDQPFLVLLISYFSTTFFLFFSFVIISYTSIYLYYTMGMLYVWCRCVNIKRIKIVGRFGVLTQNNISYF